MPLAAVATKASEKAKVVELQKIHIQRETKSWSKMLLKDPNNEKTDVDAIATSKQTETAENRWIMGTEGLTRVNANLIHSVLLVGAALLLLLLLLLLPPHVCKAVSVVGLHCLRLATRQPFASSISL
mgnify:CR=1 FL=1